MSLRDPLLLYWDLKQELGREMLSEVEISMYDDDQNLMLLNLFKRMRRLEEKVWELQREAP
jgi:hypothetical protein